MKQHSQTRCLKHYLPGGIMSKKDRLKTLEEAVRIVLDHLAPDGDTSEQYILYSNALHPFNDNKTIVDFLRESLKT